MQIDSGGLKITSYRGGLALLGPSIDEAVQSFGITDLPSKPLHITLLNAAEFKALKKIGDTDARDVSLDRIYILGQVTNKSVRFLVVVWNHGDIWRQSRGLGRKEFHITLSDEDDHKISKGVPALLASCSREELLATAEHLGEDGMDHTTVACWGDPSLVSSFPRFILC
jgi:atypical dual specificity phosphatase